MIAVIKLSRTIQVIKKTIIEGIVTIAPIIVPFKIISLILSLDFVGSGNRKIIKNGNKNMHQKLIYLALVLSTIFLVSYVIHHATHNSASYEGEGILRYLYYIILLSHIILSAIIIPLVLITLSRALKESFEYHKKIAKITFPIWLYVSATGVLVYLLISPYY